MELLWLTGLTLIIAVGLILAVFQLPGTWVILGGAILYAWQGQWENITPAILCLMGGLAVAAELWELASSAAFAQRAGASSRTAWFALAGGFLGMFIFSIPIPVIGSVFGAVAGCFVGALIGEMTVRDDLAQAARIGLSAAIGRVIGTLGKLVFALAMAALALGTALVNTWR